MNRLPGGRRCLTLLACALLLGAGSCARKTMQTTPTVLVPTIEQAKPASTEPEPPPPTVVPMPTDPPGFPATVQKPRLKPHKPVHRKPAPAPPQQPEPEPPKPETKPTPASGAQITADVPRAAVQSQRQSAEALLRGSQDKLARINRGLSASEQNMLQQARNYIMQSTQALAANDTERAYNLAVKASLLANELIK